MTEKKAKKDKATGDTKKNLGHMLAFRLNDADEKILAGICKRSELSRPKVVKALIRMAATKTIKVKSDKPETTLAGG